MKYQTYYPYPLHEHFQSPFWDFFEDKKNIKTIEEITDSRIKPNHRIYSENPKTMYMETITQSKIWLWTSIKDDWIYVSPLFLILRKIWDLFISRLPNNTFNFDDYSVIIWLLKWGMIHEYHTIGKEGEDLMDILDKEAEAKYWKVLEARNKLVPFYTEEIEPRGENLELMNLQAKAFEEVRKYVYLTDKKLTKKTIEDIDKLCIQPNNFYKFSKEWIDFIKEFDFDENIIKGFRQIRIKRHFKFNIGLLIAVITAVYFDIELFLYYNPYLYEMWICDKDNLKFEYDNTYIVMNFNNIIKSVFCEHCLEKMVGETRKKLKNGKNIENNQEIIKNMFDGVLNQLSSICPDDVSLVIEGKVNDTNRMHEINEKLPNADVVGYTRHSGNNKKVKFVIKDDLKNCKKRIERK